MKFKNGKELSYLELIKRLNIMGVEYNSNIIGKKYYIDLYNNAIKSSKNKEKIKNDIEKDQIYINFYNEKLKKRKECSFLIEKEKNIIDNNLQIYNNKNYKENFNSKKNLFGDFNGSLLNKIVLSHLCFITYDHAKNNSETFEKILNKLNIPIHALNKISIKNACSKIKEIIIELINIIDIIIIDKFSYIVIFSFIVILFIIFIFFIKRK